MRKIKRQNIRYGLKIGSKYTTSFIRGRNGRKYTTGKVNNKKYWSWIY